MFRDRNMFRNHRTVFVIAREGIVEEVSRQIDESFIRRAVAGEVFIAEVSIPKIGDLATLEGVVEILEGDIPVKVINGLSPEGARLAVLWNWRIKTRHPVRETAVRRLMEQLDLEIVRNQVRDRRTDEILGTIESGEQVEDSRFFSPNPGCYWLRQTNSWRVIPGFFGAWTQVRGTSETRKCTASGGMSSSRRIVDYIRVSVWNQVGAYAWRSRNNSSFVDGEDWEYVWIWEVQAGGARTDSDHYSRWDGTTLRCSL